MNNLAKMRLLRGWTQYELGARVPTSQARIWRMEHDYEVPNDWIKQKLADLLEVEVADLFSESKEDLKVRYERLEKKQQDAGMDQVVKGFYQALREAKDKGNKH